MIRAKCTICNKEIDFSKSIHLRLTSESDYTKTRHYLVCNECLKSIEKFMQGKTNG